MRCRWVVALGLAAACGRLGFDATEPLADAGATSGDAADASPDAAPGSLVAYIKAFDLDQERGTLKMSVALANHKRHAPAAPGRPVLRSGCERRFGSGRGEAFTSAPLRA